MTPNHQQLIHNMLQFVYARSIELNNSMAIPRGKNPPQYTAEMMWASPLGKDLTAISNYVEGYQIQENVTVIIQRVMRALFGNTLSQSGYRPPQGFHKTPLGEMIFAAYTRYYPADAWMRTSEVVKLYGVKRQTIYDWAEEGKLPAYYVRGTQMFHRKQVEKHHSEWLQRKPHS